MANHGTRSGFTLIEMMVVVAITGILAGLSLAAVQRARAAADRVRCTNHLRQIALALHHYHDAHHRFPPGTRRPPDPMPFLAWSARLLPFLEGGPLWEQTQSDYRRQPDFGVPKPHAGLSTVLSIFICPADGRTHGVVLPEGWDVALTDYLGVSGQTSATHDGVLFLDSGVRLSGVTDGTSNTLMVGERPPSPDFRFGWWYAGIGQAFDGDADATLGVEGWRTTFRTPTCPAGPYSFRPGDGSNPCDTFHFWSKHPGGAHFAFVDGSVRFLPYRAAPVMAALASRAGGENVDFPN
jgi:prepilin-type N-terminal cleavage/methylation domain-containing protein/prepilin-type processing-associated H-X9-DG protein